MADPALVLVGEFDANHAPDAFTPAQEAGNVRPHRPLSRLLDTVSLGFANVRDKVFHFLRVRRPPHAVRIPLFRSGSVFANVKLFGAGVLCSFIFGFLPYRAYMWLQSLPDPHLLTRRDLEVTTKIYDRNGVLLYEVFADENRVPIPLAEMSKYVKDATIAIEDQDFYRHNGLSLRGIIRAARETYVNKNLQGGSTITQQLIKSALLTSDLSVARKVREAILAIWAEHLYSKDQILEMYLNQVPYGGTSWGIESASRTFFKKSSKDLTLAEAALLAGLPAATSDYSPLTHPDKAIGRQKMVLDRMVASGFITVDQAKMAKSEPLHFRPQSTAIRAPHFVMYVKGLLEKRYSSRMIERGGLIVKTSLDIRVQELAEEIVRTEIEKLKGLGVGNAAVLVTDPKTGEILAMVGSRDYWNVEQDGNVNVTTSLNSPGSTIKVVNYAAALERGMTAATILEDTPVVYTITPTERYAPVNYDSIFHGFVPIRYALANSYNVPAVKVLDTIGVKRMIEKGRLMGIESWTDESRYGLSLTLGGGDVTMVDMNRVYGTLANRGKRVDIMPILEITDYTGRVIEKHHPSRPFVAMRDDVSWILGNILSDNAARTRAFGYNSSLSIAGKTVSVKTGTSNDKRDNWTIGYTPSYVVSVWVGNNDNTPMNPQLVSGITGAAPIWHEVMAELLKDKLNEVMPKPESVVSVPCYYGREEFFIKGTQPSSGRCGPLPVATPSAETPTPTP